MTSNWLGEDSYGAVRCTRAWGVVRFPSGANGDGRTIEFPAASRGVREFPANLSFTSASRRPSVELGTTAILWSFEQQELRLSDRCCHLRHEVSRTASLYFNFALANLWFLIRRWKYKPHTTLLGYPPNNRVGSLRNPGRFTVRMVVRHRCGPHLR